MKAYQEALSSLFEQIGEDPKRSGLQKTPERMARMYQSFITGHQQSAQSLLGEPLLLDNSQGEETVLVDHIPFCALCEHHLVPFFGEVHLAYIPQKHVVGLGRIFQYVESISRKLVLQENLCFEIADTLHSWLKSKALLVKMTALHTCSTLSQKIPRGTSLTTQSFRGDSHYKSHLQNQVHDLS